MRFKASKAAETTNIAEVEITRARRAFSYHVETVTIFEDDVKPFIAAEFAKT